MERYLDGQELVAEEVAHALKTPSRAASCSRSRAASRRRTSARRAARPARRGRAVAGEEGLADRGRGRRHRGVRLQDGRRPVRGPDQRLPRAHRARSRSDATLVNARTHDKERIGQLLTLQGKEHEPADEFGAGDIGAVAKLKDVEDRRPAARLRAQVELPSLDFPEPVMSFAITPKAKGDEEKVGDLAAPAQRGGPDAPAAAATRRPASSSSPGMSQMHVEVAVERLKRRFGVEVELHQPRVPYLETIRKESRAHGRYKKQTGGRGQFGDCHIVLEPLEGHTGYEFVDKIVGGVIPQSFRPAVDKGIQEAMLHGELAGAPVQGVRVRLVDGSYHTVDSSEMAFKIAGSMAFKQAYEKADPVLLEPIMEVDVTVPDEAVGAVNGDLNSRRGRLQGMEPTGGHDHDQRRGADGRDAHVLPVADVDDRRPRRLPHALPALRRGAEPRRAEADRRDEEGAGRSEGLSPRKSGASCARAMTTFSEASARPASVSGGGQSPPPRRIA